MGCCVTSVIAGPDESWGGGGAVRESSGISGERSEAEKIKII